MTDVSWRFRIDDKPRFTKAARSDTGHVVWHTGTFAGSDRGIADVGGPVDLVSVSKWSELDVIHKLLVAPDPSFFFALPHSVWYYTGLAGHAPDFVGFTTQGELVVGELKWSEGWNARLLGQFQRYSDELLCGDPSQFALQFSIAAPQTCATSLINEILSQSKTLSKWESVHLRFGFMQLGWIPQINSEFYIRVRWFDSTEWNGTDFLCSDEYGPECF